jgi:hypothetical protein
VLHISFVSVSTLKIADENTLWLLNPQPGDHDRQAAYDRANHCRLLPLYLPKVALQSTCLHKELSPVTLAPLKLASLELVHL